MTRSPLVRGSLALALLAAPALLPAGEPWVLDLQGRLEDPSGVPMTGSASVAIRLYDLSTGGSSLHDESDVVSLDSRGVFSTPVGDDGGNPLDPASFDRQLWVGVAVDGGAELSPRLPLRAAPYAMRASVAATVETSNVVHVPAVGSKAENGAALRAAVQALTGTFENPKVIRVGPGTFDLGASSLVLSDYVSLHGAGRRSTVIQNTGNHAVVTMGSSSALQDVWLQGGSGASGIGAVEAVGKSDLYLSRVTINWGQLTQGYGIHLSGGSSALLEHVDLQCVYATGSNAGLRVDASSARVLGGSYLAAYGGSSSSTGLWVRGYGSVEAWGAQFDAASSLGNNHGALVEEGTLEAHGCRFGASPGVGAAYGLVTQTDASKTLVLRSCLVKGATGTVVLSGTGADARVFSSELSGGASVANTNTLTCAFVTDENGVGYASSCP